ncbi:hypothetical protein GGR50DRAFT_668893 [Xylaria sp. CBS 124048]|nr:hypothetical protein GGR50DRAFT_668893 [Xylaria sp. CBS 124048]
MSPLLKWKARWPTILLLFSVLFSRALINSLVYIADSSAPLSVSCLLLLVRRAFYVWKLRRTGSTPLIVLRSLKCWMVLSSNACSVFKWFMHLETLILLSSNKRCFYFFFFAGRFVGILTCVRLPSTKWRHVKVYATDSSPPSRK